MADNYADILNRSWDEIPEPKVLPNGTWLLRGNNVGYFPAKEEGKSTRVAFFYTPKEAMDDVDEAELDQLGPDYDLADSDVVKQFFINRSKDWDAVRKHLALHGIDTTGKSQVETFKEFNGTEVLSYLGTKTYTDSSGKTVEQNDPTQFAAVS